MMRLRRWRYNWESPGGYAVTLLAGLSTGYLLWVWLAVTLAEGRH